MAKRQIVIAALLLIAAQVPYVETARAEATTIRLKHVSYDDLKKKCDAAGGQFDSIGKTDYWCQTKDSSVTCDTKNCTGVTGHADAPQSAPTQLRDPKTVGDTLTPQ